MKLITKYLKYWPWFVISVVACMILAFVFLLYVTPSYQVSTTLLIQEDKKGEGMLKETAFSDLNMFHTTKSVDNETQVLRSINLLEKVFNDLSLNTRYFINGTFKRTELYDTTLPIRVIVNKLASNAYAGEIGINILNPNSFEMVFPDDSRHVYQFGQVINQGYSIKIVKGPAFNTNIKNLSISFVNTRQLAKGYRDQMLDITPIVKESNTLVVSLYDNIPQRGANILSHLVELYNKENVAYKNHLALASMEFIDNRLKYLTNDLTSAEQNVEQYKQSNSVTNVASDAEASLQKAEEYKQQLEAMQVQLNIVRSIEDYFDKSGNQFTLVPSTLGLQDATLLALINKFNDLQQEYQRLLRNNEAGNPLVVNVREQLTSLKQNIQENLRNIKRGININMDNLASNTSRFQSRIKTAPVLEHGLQERSREQSVKQALYQYLIQKREETALSLSANLPAAKVIDPPTFDWKGARPKKQLIYLYAFILGGIIPIFFIYTKDALNKKVENVGDVNMLTEVKVLGELGHVNKKEALLIGKGGRSSIDELFRYIRTNLSFSNNHNSNQVLLVTSSIQGEGKTFMSINLGTTLSRINKKVVILEFDLRKPDLLKYMKLKSSVGITDYINSDTITVEDIIKPSNISPNLYVISCGTVENDPGEDILNPRIATLFNELREIFDYIIVDTSPIGLVADAYSLAPYTDGSIYVVRYNYTEKIHLNVLQDAFKNNKLKNPMIVLNDGKAENLKNYVYGNYGYASK